MKILKLKNKVFLFLFVLFWFSVFFASSIFILSMYTGGDQVHYRQFYSDSKSLSYFEAYIYARGVIGAYDPVGIFFLWLGSWLGVPKVIYISIWNSVFLLVIGRVLGFYRVGLIVYPLVFSNFYILVLITGAERLKFGIIFLALSVVAAPKIKPLCIITSVLSHFQLFLLWPSLVIRDFYSRFFRIIKSKKININYLNLSFLSILFVTLVAIYFKEGLMSKFNSYFVGSFDLFSLLNFLLLFLVAIMVTRQWKRMAISLLPFFAIILVLGDSRINMLAVIFVFWAFMEERRISHPLSIALLCYFSVKSIRFVYNIYNYGDGFV